MEEHCVDCGHGAHYHRYKGFDGLCGYGGCDCKLMVYPKHEDTPRRNPRVAPGLRDAIRLAVEQDEDVRYWLREVLINPDHIDHIVRIAADIAAAQGGTVDRDALVAGDYVRQLSTGNRGYFRGFASDGKAILETQVQKTECDLSDLTIVTDKEMAAIRQIRQDIGSRLAAVPSAPGGTERVREAWLAFSEAFDYDAHPVVLEAVEVLRKSIAALGTPQGPDSLKWTKVLPTEPGRYLWKSPVGNESLMTLHKEKRGLGVWDDDQFILISRFTGAWFYGPIVIPEPAEPLSAGEAKERGE